MNKDRRKMLGEAERLRDQLLDLIEYVKAGEEEAYEGMPESLQGSECGEAMQAAISTMDDMISALQEMDFDEVAQ